MPPAAPPTSDAAGVSAPPKPAQLTSTMPFVVGRLEVRQLAPPLFDGARAAPPVEPVPYEQFRLLATLQVGHSHLSMLDLSLDETRLLAVSESEGRLRVYDTESRRLIAQAPVSGFDLFGVGQFLFWPALAPAHRVIFSGVQGFILLDPTGSADPMRLSQDRAGSIKVQSGLVGSIRAEGAAHASVLTLYEPESSLELVPLLSVATSEWVEDWVLSPDRTQLGVVYFPSNELEWIDLKSRQVLWRASAPEFANSLDLSPDGTLLAVGGKELRVLSVADPGKVGGFTQFDNNIHQVHFAPAGDAVVASSYDGHLRIVSATTDSAGPVLRKVLRHAGTANVYAFRFTRDGRRLYSCSGDRTLRLFGL